MCSGAAAFTDAVQDTIPELMDKLKYVEAADLGCDELSDSEVDAVHVNVKGSVTTRRTRVLKGVKLDKSFEPPSHYMCDSFCCPIACVKLTFCRQTYPRDCGCRPNHGVRHGQRRLSLR